MARKTNAELEARVRELEAEIVALNTIPAPSPVPPRPSWRQRSWAWTLLSTVVIVIGSLLAPVAVVSAWARVQLTDTEQFVAAYAPLAHSPAVKQFVADETSEAISASLDLPALTADVIDGLIALGTPPRVTQALEALKGPAAAGIESLINSRVTSFVESPAFEKAWADALEISHAQLVATMNNDPDAAIELGSDGTIGVQLGPIIDKVKASLVDQGITFAERIPSIDRTVTIAQSDAIPTIQVAYNVAQIAGGWLPLIALVFLVLGVLVARRRSVALIWAAVALAIIMSALAAAFAIARGVAATSISASVVPTDVVRVLFDAVTTPMRTTVTSVIVLAVAVAFLGWAFGPFTSSTRLRGFAHRGSAWVRDSLESRGVSTGVAGEWLYQQRVLLRTAVGVIASAVVIFARPLSIGLIVWTAVVALLVIAILELVQRPTEPVESTPSGEGVPYGHA